jgi:hypothetical protein
MPSGGGHPSGPAPSAANGSDPCAGHNLLVPGRRKRKGSKVPKGTDDPLDPYRRVRKPVPPPARVLPDRRRELREETARREARGAEEEEGREGGGA